MDGDVRAVESVGSAEWYLVDTGMYDVSGYGCVYVLDGEHPAIVETGIGTNHERILDAVDALGIERTDVELIAVTHVHLDHAGGAGFLAEACPNATVAVHRIGAPHLIDPGRLVAGTKDAVGDQWKYYTDPRPVHEDQVRTLEDGEVIDLGEHALEALHAPGHAPHQVAFYERTTGAVFTGDAAGIWIPLRGVAYPTSPPPNFDLEQALADVETIRAKEPEALLFTHFGDTPYRAGILADYAERLAEWVESVSQVYDRRGDIETVIDHFAERSDLDEIWGERKAADEAGVNVAGAIRYLDRRGR